MDALENSRLKIAYVMSFLFVFNVNAKIISNYYACIITIKTLLKKLFKIYFFFKLRF